MKWLHGYSAIMFSVASVILSITSRYSRNHFQEGNSIIASTLNKALYYFMPDINESSVASFTAAPWYQSEENLIILFQGAALVFALLSIIFATFSVISREKSIFYATSILITAYSLYFINTKLALFITFITIIIILNLRKRFGLYT